MEDGVDLAICLDKSGKHKIQQAVQEQSDIPLSEDEAPVLNGLHNIPVESLRS
jgi:hypothetical protein